MKFRAKVLRNTVKTNGKKYVYGRIASVKLAPYIGKIVEVEVKNNG